MAGKYIKYAGPLNWNDLPVDSYALIAATCFHQLRRDERRWMGGRKGNVYGRRGRRAGLSIA
jgi:hypothetical protein